MNRIYTEVMQITNSDVHFITVYNDYLSVLLCMFSFASIQGRLFWYCLTSHKKAAIGLTAA